ncbi:MAG: hypothetical protein AAGA25_04400 [Planctomycetota bacterium]
MQCSIFIGTGEAEEVRGHFRRFMSRGHEGWNDTFDQQFDDRAVWFYLTNERGKHLAAARLIFRKAGEHSGPLPSDLGDLSRFLPPDDGTVAMSQAGSTINTATLPGSASPEALLARSASQPPSPSDMGSVAVQTDASQAPPITQPMIAPGAICEASGMSFKSRRHLALLLPIYMRWMQQRQLGAIYSLYDADNEFVNWLQCQLLLFRHVRGATVAFDEFRYKDGDPVTWQATVLDPLLRTQSLANAQRNRREAWDGQAPKVEVIDHVPQTLQLPKPVPQPAVLQQPEPADAAAWIP